jgi:hypothetical protein
LRANHFDARYPDWKSGSTVRAWGAPSIRRSMKLPRAGTPLWNMYPERPLVVTRADRSGHQANRDSRRRSPVVPCQPLMICSKARFIRCVAQWWHRNAAPVKLRSGRASLRTASRLMRFRAAASSPHQPLRPGRVLRAPGLDFIHRHFRQHVRRHVAVANAKTRRAFLRTGFERSNSLWTKHHGSLDQSSNLRFSFPHVQKFAYADSHVVRSFGLRRYGLRGWTISGSTNPCAKLRSESAPCEAQLWNGRSRNVARSSSHSLR